MQYLYKQQRTENSSAHQINHTIYVFIFRTVAFSVMQYQQAVIFTLIKSTLFKIPGVQLNHDILLHSPLNKNLNFMIKYIIYTNTEMKLYFYMYNNNVCKIKVIIKDKLI